MIVANDQLEGFVSSVVQVFESAEVGDPTDPGTEVGPLSSIAARDTVVAQVKRAVEQGAKSTAHRRGRSRPGLARSM